MWLTSVLSIIRCRFPISLFSFTCFIASSNSLFVLHNLSNYIQFPFIVCVLKQCCSHYFMFRLFSVNCYLLSFGVSCFLFRNRFLSFILFLPCPFWVFSVFLVSCLYVHFFVYPTQIFYHQNDAARYWPARRSTQPHQWHQGNFQDRYCRDRLG